MAGPVVYPIITDHLGSPRKILAQSGALAWSWTNTEPYGYQAPNELHSGSSFTYDGRFPGQRFDRSTGALHNGFRTYSPKLGRYMQSDPLGLAAGWNGFAYVGNSPTLFFDPLGLSKRDEQLIRKTFENSVSEMNNLNLRNDNKFMNNVFGRKSTVPDFVNRALGHPVPGYLDCVGQTDFLMERLRAIQPHLDDEWLFSYDYAPYHQWAVALPMNKADAPIWMDPRANEISTGSPCPSCGGVVGEGSYTKERVDELLGR